MNKSFSISFILIFYCSIIFAQNNINSYKYILVPNQFEFQNSEDQHQLNSLTKFLFNRAGYTVLLTGENYPDDLARNSCLALKAKVNNNSSLFKTKMTIDLLDCQNKIVFSTKEGGSKEKEYKKAYQEAIRKAFVDLEEVNYTYDNSLNDPSKTEVEPKEVVSALAKVNVPIIKSLEVKEISAEPTLKEITPTKANELKEVEDIKIAEKSVVKSIEGKFNFQNWGISTISKNKKDYTVVGGDENFEFATIYKTSKPTVFIIKWAAFKQPQLLEINSEGNLLIDTEKTVKTIKRVH